MNFCLTDGSALLSSEYESEPTVVMGAKLPSATAKAGPRIGASSVPYIVIGVLALIAGGAIVALLMSRTSTPPTVSVPQNTAATLNTAPSNTASVNAPASNKNSEVVQYPDSVQQPLTANSVKNLIDVWKRAQESKSFASYQACYDTSFVGIKKTKTGHSQSYSYSSWMADRRRMIGSSVNLSLDVSNLQIRVDGDTAIVDFDQYYRSLRYSDWGPKEITVRMTSSGPKIVREELKASYPL